jgi:hypothetical protein
MHNAEPAPPAIGVSSLFFPFVRAVKLRRLKAIDLPCVPAQWAIDSSMATGGLSHGSVTEAAGKLACLGIIAEDYGKDDDRSIINQKQHLGLMDLSDDELSLI